MKNMTIFLILFLSLIILGSPTYAGGGISRLARSLDINDFSNFTRKTLVQKTSSYTHRQTLGHKPEKQPPPKWSYESLPKKVKFLDNSGERFIILSGKSPSTELPSPTIKKINEYTILVTYRKD